MRPSFVSQPWFDPAVLSMFTLVACPLAVLIASDCLSGDPREALVGLADGATSTLDVHLAEPHPPTDFQSALRAPWRASCRPIPGRWRRPRSSACRCSTRR